MENNGIANGFGMYPQSLLGEIDDDMLEDLVSGLGEDDEDEVLEVDFLQLARDAFSNSNDYFVTNVAPVYEKNVKQYRGRHEDPKYELRQAKFKSSYFNPKTRAAIQKHEAAGAAAFFSTNDVVAIGAVNESRDLQRAAAAYFKEKINLRLTTSGPKSIPWFLTLNGAHQDAKIYGMCVSKQTWNHEKQKPEIVLIEPENIRFDPSANWMDPVNTSPYFIELMPMYVSEIREKIRNSGWIDVPDDILRSSSRQNGSDSVRRAREGKREDPKERTSSISEYDIVWVHVNHIRVEGKDYVFHTVGTNALLTNPVPIEKVYLHGNRPYVIGYSMIEAHRNFPSGLPEISRDIQREINDLINQRMDNVRLVLDKRYFIKRNQRVDFDSVKMNAAGSITLLDNPETDVKIVPTPDVTSSSYKEAEHLNIMFDDIVGGFNSASVQANRSLNETVGGMSMLSQSANQVSEYLIRIFSETWVEPVLRQLLMLERHYESDVEIMTIAGDRAGLIKEFGVNSIDDEFLMQDVVLTVSVGLGATNPSTQLEKFMMALRALEQTIPGISNNLDQEEVVKEVFGKLGLKDGARFFKPKEAQVDPEKEALKAQIQEMQMKLMKRKSDELEAAEAMLKRAQAVKTNVESSFGAMQAGEAVAMTPAIAPVGDAILKAAGYKPEQVGIDPNIDMVAARRQAVMHQDVDQNNDPLEPNTGQNNFNVGIRGGVTGMSDRD
jgi:hypothetical protein